MFKSFNPLHHRIWAMLELLHGFNAITRHQALIRKAITAADEHRLTHPHKHLHVKA